MEKMLLKRRVPFLLRVSMHLKSYQTNTTLLLSVVNVTYPLEEEDLCSITSLVCWPAVLPSESRRSLPEGTWTQKETTAESGGSPPSVCRNAPGRWHYKTAAWTGESRTMLIETHHHISNTNLSVTVCYCKAFVSLLGLPVMESWAQPRYIHTGKMNQMQIWVLPVPGLQLISAGNISALCESSFYNSNIIHHDYAICTQMKQDLKCDYRDNHTWCATHPSPLHRLSPFLTLRHGYVWTCHFQQ